MTHRRAGLGPPVAAPGHLVSTSYIVWTPLLVWTTFFPPYIEIWDHLRFSVGGHPELAPSEGLIPWSKALYVGAL